MSCLAEWAGEILPQNILRIRIRNRTPFIAEWQNWEMLAHNQICLNVQIQNKR